MIVAAKLGEFLILSTDEVPNWVRVESKDFCDINDPAVTAKYIYAFKNLCERGYIEYDGGSLVRLTYPGFEKARQLAAKIKNKSVS